MAVLNETDLYAPVKKLLEEQGYTVRDEVDRCDLVALRSAEPRVIVELKRRFALSLVYQASSASASHMPSIWPVAALTLDDHCPHPDDLVWDLLGQVLFELLFPLSDDVSRWRRPEGEPVCGAHHAVRCDLVFGGSVQNPNHDAGIRIDDQAPGRRALSGKRSKDHVIGRVAATSGTSGWLVGQSLPHALPVIERPSGPPLAAGPRRESRRS
jgi:hypothetical protein